MLECKIKGIIFGLPVFFSASDWQKPLYHREVTVDFDITIRYSECVVLCYRQKVRKKEENIRKSGEGINGFRAYEVDYLPPLPHPVKYRCFDFLRGILLLH